MTNEKTKLSFREHINLLGYGFRTTRKLLPSYYPCMLARSLVTAAQPLVVLFFSARIISELAGVQDVRSIIIYASFAVGLSFLLSASKALLTRFIESRAGFEQALRLIDMMVSEKYATMDFSHTEDSSIAEKLAQMSSVSRYSGRGLVALFEVPSRVADSLFSLILAILLIADAFSLGGMDQIPLWGWASIFGAFAVGIFIELRLRSRAVARIKQITTLAASVNASADYYFQYIGAEKAAKDVRFYNQAGILRRIFIRMFDSKPWTAYFGFMGIINGFSLGLLALVAGGFYIFTGYGAIGGAIPVGSIVQTVGAVTALTGAVGILFSLVSELYNNAPHIEPMQGFMGLSDRGHGGSKPISAENDNEFHIEFRNVSFRYPGREEYALRELNLKLDCKDKLAVVGPNGSGKTTMVKLLCRLYDPTEGEILLNGVNIKEYSFEHYIKLFSVVFQDFKLFPLPLGQNVAVGESYDDKVVDECLDKVGFAERFEDMPQRLDTVLFKDYDESGTAISGGESQKIALARALYKTAPFVILDEPTAALDPVSEYEVYTSFDRTVSDRTMVFISHRMSACRFCERVAVFEAGRLIQNGSHDELLTDADGLYSKLWNTQAEYYV